MITRASNVPHGLYWWGVTPCAPWFVNRKRRAQDCPPYRSMRALPFVQGDAGADPGFVDVEVDAHHFALAHADEIVHQRGTRISVRPDKHHSDFGFRFLTADGGHECRIVDLLLQNPFVRIFQSIDFFTSRLHVHTMPGK